LFVKLKNNGIGPLLVTRFIASNGNENRKDIISWMPDLPEGMFWSTFCSTLDGACIAPDGEIVLIKLTGDPEDKTFAATRDEVRKAFSKLTIRLEYTDIYNRKMPEKERNLSWFSRHFAEPDELE
jgi:hypothetical protein